MALRGVQPLPHDGALPRVALRGVQRLPQDGALPRVALRGVQRLPHDGALPRVALRGVQREPHRWLRAVADSRTRCAWAEGDPLYADYHDREWGVPLRDDRQLFELLCLEGAQAGLAWITILRKREGYRRAFHGFEPARVAAYDETDVARLLADAGIVRNRAKVRAAIGNAGAWLRLTQETGSPATHLWSFVDGSPVQNRWRAIAEVPAETDASRALSHDLQQRGFTFVGPTIAYAFMQSAGLVNDHVADCFRHSEVRALA